MEASRTYAEEKAGEGLDNVHSSVSCNLPSPNMPSNSKTLSRMSIQWCFAMAYILET